MKFFIVCVLVMIAYIALMCDTAHARRYVVRGTCIGGQCQLQTPVQKPVQVQVQKPAAYSGPIQKDVTVNKQRTRRVRRSVGVAVQPIVGVAVDVCLPRVGVRVRCR